MSLAIRRETVPLTTLRVPERLHGPRSKTCPVGPGGHRGTHTGHGARVAAGAMPEENKPRRLPKRIDTAVQQIYNEKWLYPPAQNSATYSFNSAWPLPRRGTPRTPCTLCTPPLPPRVRRMCAARLSAPACLLLCTPRRRARRAHAAPSHPPAPARA